MNGDIMNLAAVFHQTYSEYAYPINDKTLHLLLRTGKDITNVTLLYGDPFIWLKDKPYKWDMKKDNMTLKYEDDLFNYFFIELTIPTKRIRYGFLLKSPKKEIIYHAKGFSEVNYPLEIENLNVFFNMPYLHQADLNNTPSWVKKTIWYQIFPDRFCNDNNPSNYDWNNKNVKNHEIYGGNLKGITKKLPYIKDLGFNGIYLTPIFEANTAHKYDTVDYLKIDPNFGTNQDFKDLVDEAHKLGIKVMLDGVFNHAGFYHPFFLDVAKNGKESKYHDAFKIIRWPAVNFKYDNKKILVDKDLPLNYETFATTPYMPKWNFESKITEDYLLNVVTYWIKNYNIDAWRLDVSNEISFKFLRKIKEAARSANENTYILGENWDSSLPWLRGDTLDGVMNYFLTHIFWDFIDLKITNHEFQNRMTFYLVSTPKNIINNQFNLISSHDTERIKHRVNGDIRRIKIAFVLLFLNHGTPSVYYGDEIGLDGANDPDNRRTMIWDESKWNYDLLSFIKKLIVIRKNYHHYDKEIKITRFDDLLIFINNDLTIIINNSNTSVPLNYTFKKLDVLNNQVLDFNKIKVIEPFSFYILK